MPGYLFFLEFFAMFFTLLCVWLATRGQVYTWPVGILATALTAIVAYKASIWGQLFLQLVYGASSFYGWWEWWQNRTGEKDNTVQIKPLLNSLVLLSLLLVAAIGTFLFRIILSGQTTGEALQQDAALTSFSLLAQALLIWRYRENWAVWIAVDIFTTWLYFSQQLYWLAFCFLVLTILAVKGGVEWEKKKIPT